MIKCRPTVRVFRCDTSSGFEQQLHHRNVCFARSHSECRFSAEPTTVVDRRGRSMSQKQCCHAERVPLNSESQRRTVFVTQRVWIRTRIKEEFNDFDVLAEHRSMQWGEFGTYIRLVHVRPMRNKQANRRDYYSALIPASSSTLAHFTCSDLT